MLRISILIVFALCSTSVFPKAIIKGKVRDAQKGTGIESVNVMMKETVSSAILGFSLSDKDGNYQLEYKGEKDSIVIVVSGFNIKQQAKTVSNKDQNLNFDVVFESVNLKEVKITPPKIRQSGDTINYLVDGFLDQNDRTIGDVLKKLPGVDVKESGQILYQDKPINKFYIEDMDLLQGKYGIATNNISAKDVSSVQILENHQPIKALKDRVLSEQAALNLKLKESAKGTITANALLGAGADPLLWTGELTAMYFAKRNQNISTYKGNNIGYDVTNEMTSFYSNEAARMNESGFLNVQSPAEPSISQKRYLFNRANIVSFNNLWKVKDYQLNANVSYVNDREDKSSFSRTEYYLPTNEILTIEENSNSRLYTNKADAEVQLNANRDSYYFNNLFKFNGAWNNERGSIFGTQEVDQKLKEPFYGITNTFDLVRNFEKSSVSVNSFNGYSVSPHRLTVRPMLYPELFETDKASDGMTQSIDLNRFVSYTKISTGYDTKKLKQNYSFSFRTDLQDMDSELKALGSEMLPDSMRNDLRFNKLEWIFSPSYTYIYKDFRASLQLPLNLTYFDVKNRTTENEKKNSYLSLNPNLFLQYKLSAFWDWNAYAGFSQNYGEIRNEYTGDIMNSYRSLVRNTGDFYKTENQSYSLSFMYRHPIRSVFGNLSLHYSNVKANLLYGYDFAELLQIKTTLEKPNYTETVSLNASVSKTIDEIASTVRLAGNYGLSSSSQLSQGEIIDYEGNHYSINPSIQTKLRSWGSLSYDFSFSENKSKIKRNENEFDPIRTTSHRANLNIFPLKGLIFNLGYEYFYNSAIASGSRAMSFGDVGVKYKWKKMEFLLDYTNIFNTKQYISASYNDISSYYYAYDLRPAEIVLRVRFKIK